MLHKEPLFKLYPRRYCACSRARGETKLRHFPEQMVPTYGSNTPTVRNYNGYITTFTRFARQCVTRKRARTPWSFTAGRVIHADVGGKRIVSTVSRRKFAARFDILVAREASTATSWTQLITLVEREPSIKEQTRGQRT